MKVTLIRLFQTSPGAAAPGPPIRRNSRAIAAKNAAEGEMMEKTEADYKNWVPAGMIRGFLLGSTAALLVGEKHRGENR